MIGGKVSNSRPAEDFFADDPAVPRPGRPSRVDRQRDRQRDGQRDRLSVTPLCGNIYAAGSPPATHAFP